MKMIIKANSHIYKAYYPCPAGVDGRCNHLAATLDDAMCRKGIYKRVGTELVINKKHQYFYQIQQQLYCSKRTVCHFIVSDGHQMHTESVAFDSAFWGETLPKLKQFYFDSIFPELVYPRILHGATRWNKDIPFPIRG